MRTLVGTIYIHLPDYRFYDSPQAGSLEGTPDGKYMERTAIEAQLRARLATGTNSRSGAILVTGYRGSGKTSLVRKVLRDLRDPRHPESERCSARLYHYSEINLAQDDIDERIILRLIAIELHRIIQGVRNATNFRWSVGENFGFPLHMSRLWIHNRIWRFARYVLPLLVALLVSNFMWDKSSSGMSIGRLFDNGHSEEVDWHVHEDEIWREEHVINFLDRAVIPFLIAILIYVCVRSLERRYAPLTSEASIRRLRIRLEQLISRMEAEVTKESVRGMSTNPAFSLFSFGKKESEFYPFVKTKEVELELIDVLRVFGKLCPKEQIVFVVDELDKLIPNSNVSISDRDRENPSDDVPLVLNGQGIKGHPNDAIRSRQETVAALFANLKHFLNVAEAKFIFIGSRELYDTVLADTSNRDPFFGSIFSDVVYVPSFLKEEQGNQRGRIEGISVTTERFVSEAILTAQQRKEVFMAQPKGTPSLGPVVQRMVRYSRHGIRQDEDSKRELLRAYESISELVSFLTFRSNGIAKRTVKLFEEHIVELSPEELRSLLPEAHANDVVVVGCAPSRMQKGLYLKLTATNQYSHHLLSYFYRPYLSIHTRYYSALSDKQLVSFTYLLDHLFKFHGFSFNHGNLELAPETIGINKVPEVRKFLSDIVESLTHNHLRVIDNGLFNYQFYKKVYHEISYLSKISERDSAAMNFTLDESLPVKQHFYKRLYHLIGLENQRKASRADGLVDAIPALHQLLGDLHYFDEEYDEALAQYRSAARMLEESIYPTDRRSAGDRFGNASAGEDGFRAHRDRYGVRFREYVKLTLKQCICLEKTQAYDDAFALSNTLSQDIIKSLEDVTGKSSGSGSGVQGRMEEDKDVVVGWRLYILAMAHRLALVEKSSRGGVTMRDMNLLKRFLERMAIHFTTDEVRYRLTGTLLMHMASIFHYGNQPRYAASTFETDRMNFASAQDLYRWALCHMLLRADQIELVKGDVGRFRELDMVEEAWRALEKAKRNAEDTWVVERGHGYWLELADCLSKFGDTMFDTQHKEQYRSLPATKFMGQELRILCGAEAEWWIKPGKPSQGMHYTPGNVVAQTLLMSAECYQVAGHPIRSVFQIKKLFYYLIEVCHEHGPLERVAKHRLLKELETLRNVAVTLIHEANRHINRPQENKVRYQTAAFSDRISFGGKEGTVMSYRSEVHEMECLYLELALRLEPESSRPQAEEFLKLNGRDAGLQLTRMRVLILSAKMDRSTVLNKVMGKALVRDFKAGDLTLEELSAAVVGNVEAFVRVGANNRHLFIEAVSGAIYSNTHLIRLLNLYGLSYMSNQSTLSWAHEQLGNWCLLLLCLSPDSMSTPFREPSARMTELHKDIRYRIGRTLDRKALSRIDPLFHYTHALNLFESAMALHNRGKGYRRVLADMCLPEEDYSDNLYHYTCSLERRRLKLLHSRKEHVFLRSMIGKLEQYHVHRAALYGMYTESVMDTVPYST